jgi:hypothetical protein
LHSCLEYFGVISLSLVTIFDFLAWKFENAYWNSHTWLLLVSIIWLAMVVIIDWIVLMSGKRLSAEKDAKHQREMDEVKSESARNSAFTDSFLAANEDRRLSAADKHKLKTMLSKHPPQKYQLHQMDRNLGEAERFAKQIHEALHDCGWSGPIYLGSMAFPTPSDFSGVSVMQSRRDANGNIPVSPAIGILELALASAGIEMANEASSSYFARRGNRTMDSGVIDICVGPKPRRPIQAS